MTTDDNIFEIMGYYIRKYTQGLHTGDLAFELFQSKKQTKIELSVGNSVAILLDSETIDWAKSLVTDYGWPENCHQTNGHVLSLTTTLKNAFAYWKVSAKPKKDTLDALEFIKNKLSNKLVVPQNAMSHLWGSYRICEFNEDKLHSVGETNFISRWCNALIQNFQWAFSENYLHNQLLFAHEAWVTSKRATTKMTTNENIQFSKVDVADDTSTALMGDVSFYRCNFCEKEMNLDKDSFLSLQRFSNVDNLFCNFCIRNGFNTNKRKNIFGFSFRAIIGFLYNVSYLGKEPDMYFSEIQDHIKIHEIIGLKNPIMTYDPESYIWFADFSKVGEGSKKIPPSDVIKTIIEILSAFNPFENIKDFKSAKFLEKFNEAVDDFHNKRYRPTGKRICIPTLLNCATGSVSITSGVSTTYRNIDFSIFKDFTSNQCKLKK